MTPIESIIRANPTPVVIRTTPEGDYNPRANADYAAGDFTDVWTYGHFTTVVSGEDSFQATLTLREIPDDLATGSTRVIVADGEYGVSHVRTRRLRGAVSGYTLELSK